MRIPEIETPNEPSGFVGVVADGWWQLADAEGYYPEDLPADWRLGYFANEHEGAYVDLAHWRAAPHDVMHDWSADVHDGFRFYLDHPRRHGARSDDPADAALIETAMRAIGPRLGGFIQWRSTDVGSLLAPTTTPGIANPLSEAAAALRCPPAIQRDVRAAGAWLRRVAEQHRAALIVLRQPASGQLTAWKDLRALLGIADLMAQR
jgi:hypothetical protein